MEPLCTIIQGTTISRKSYLIGAIKMALKIESFLEKSPLLLLGPTSVATFNISASIVHFALHIAIKNMTYLHCKVHI